MAIPDFQSIMLPLLKYISDGKEYNSKEVTEVLADKFNLTKEEKNEMLPSGKSKTFTNRVAWAKAHLVSAGLIKSITRGHYKISESGIMVLSNNPDLINMKYLDQFKDYKDWRKGNKNKEDYNQSDDDSSKIEDFEKKTPDEIIKEAHIELRQKLIQEVLTELKNCSPQYFERVVLDLLVRMGYGGTFSDAASTTSFTGDEGIDGVIKEDKLGLDSIYIQAKKWENQVSRPEIQKFAGALMGKNAKKGVFITTSNFSSHAVDYAKHIADQRIVLIDGTQLAEYMIDHDLGVSISETIHIKTLDTDYFNEE
jgi:restriction system protein